MFVESKGMFKNVKLRQFLVFWYLFTNMKPAYNECMKIEPIQAYRRWEDNTLYLKFF